MTWVDLVGHAAVCGNAMQLTKDFRLGPRHQAEGQQLLQGKGPALQTERQQHPSGHMAAASNMENGMCEPHISGKSLFQICKAVESHSKWNDSHSNKHSS